MPTYEYACKGCGFEFEREQRITDKPVKKCPECGALKARRLISRTSFVLKGGGWYNDLYASPKAKAEGKSQEGGEAAASEKSEKASGDAKSESTGASEKSGEKTDGKSGKSGDKGSGKKASKAAD